jgi:hypothetical protein
MPHRYQSDDYRCQDNGQRNAEQHVAGARGFVVAGLPGLVRALDQSERHLDILIESTRAPLKRRNSLRLGR